ncbi:WD40 repeat-containing protein [Synechococcus sp. PCC 7502]|uniref:WD40 domain-containing protein n=1 Tax=Synechococcus sp. PCC 7502 TaxID=1173263 RepID=UPI00029FA343|nr:NB-ARC domain-containing protein [Synechococcus sp. PCC 7502]AFY73408.1 WD40 repeat-containing protein [Synechococcus sp. PCC 7502]
MRIGEAIALVEQLLERGRLTKVQEIVFRQTWEGQTYLNISVNAGYDPSYIKDVGSELWRSLSTALNEKVTKSNIHGVLKRYAERQKDKNVSLPVNSAHQNISWGEAIDISQFYGRKAELQKLNQWIERDRSRVVTILGIGGIGKTALSLKLAEQLQGEFEYVIWRSLRNAPIFELLLAEIIALLSKQQEIQIAPTTHIPRLIHYLQQHRCLLILDNVESILLSAKPRQYLEGYEAYGDLFREVSERSHQSCVLLTSREQIEEVAILAGESLPIRVLPLRGLAIAEGMAILEDKGLPLTMDKGQQLIDLYAGNPLALKIISTSILELFDGQISEFFNQGAAVFNGIRKLLDRQLDRLSDVEKQIMFGLAINREWVSVVELQGDFSPTISTPRLLESLEYLQGRSLIEKNKGKFTQQPVVMEYMIEKLLTAVRTEISNQTPQLFLRYALIKAQAKDYVRESQIRMIMQPLLVMLQEDLGGEQAIALTIKQILQNLSSNSSSATSYGAGNCLNLLCHLQADLTGLDVSGLSIRQADLRDVSLHQVNLSHANLATSMFAEAIGEIHKIVVSPDDRLVANSCNDGSISIWQVGSGQNVLNLKAHDSYVIGLVFTPDSRRLISGSFDKHIKIWDISTGECLESWQSSADIYGIALSSDGKILAYSGEDGSILLWDLATKRLLQKLTGHTAQVRDIAFQPYGTLLASSSFDLTIKIWDLTTGECIETLIGHTQVVWSLSFNAEGTKLVSGSFDQLMKVWDVQTASCIQTIQAHTAVISGVIFSPDDQLIISGSFDSTIKFWEIAPQDNWQCSRVLQRLNNIGAIALDSTGKILISGDYGGELKFWDVESGQALRTLNSIPKAFKTLAFHSEGNLLASSGDDRKIRLWDITSNQCLSTITGHAMSIWRIVFPPQGNIIASCSTDGTLKLWNVVNNNHIQELPPPLQKDFAFIVAIAFHEDILASGSSDAMIRLWNYRTRELVQSFMTVQGSIIVNLDFHPQGHLLASACHDSTDLRVWDIKTGTCHQTLQGHSSHIWSVDFHPQGEILASGSEDKTIRLWHIETGECLQVLKGHASTINAVKFSPDGAYLSSSSNDLTIRIWEVATGECIRILEGHIGSVTGIAYDPAQLHQLASCSYDDTIRLWNTDTGECLKVLRPQRIYEGMNITGATGITSAQQATLKGLGAVEIT